MPAWPLFCQSWRAYTTQHAAAPCFACSLALQASPALDVHLWVQLCRHLITALWASRLSVDYSHGDATCSKKYSLLVLVAVFVPGICADNLRSTACIVTPAQAAGPSCAQWLVLVRAGSRLGDFCTWCWCGPCALCQETRTLWTNNVHDGVWHGPTQLVASSGPPVPPLRQFMIADV